MLGILGLALASLLIGGSRAFDTVERKCVDHLNEDDVIALQKALHDLQEDEGAMGYQNIAGFHGFPAQCDDGHGHKVACCLHGMPSFPMWHRLYVVQMERALMRKKSHISIPYWDWTKPLTHLPDLVSHALFVDPEGGKAHDNSWYRGDIKLAGHKTARAVDDRLFEQVEQGQHTHLFDSILDALEEDDFCKFEIQFELAHNAIHYLVGGRHDYSMSHLEYTSYDPIFFLHHSNTDRIFAIWQRLQELRGKDPNSADCAHNLIHTPMAPFNRDDMNELELTKTHAKPAETFDYRNLGYHYDDLSLNGMSPEELNEYLHERSGKEKYMASFRLSGFGGSANAVVYVCRPADDQQAVDHCEKAGDFFMLGGPTEMHWEFYRAYHFDVTETVHRFEEDHHGHYYVKAEIFSVNGTHLPSNLLPHPELVHRPAREHVDDAPVHHDDDHLAVRKNINDLTREEIYELRHAMEKFQHDHSVDGYQATAEFHGLPARCPRPDAKDRVACCIHGMATFPHWHRLFVTQVEDALIRRGSPIGMPYWDWTAPMTHIPFLAANETYEDPVTHESHKNPFHGAEVAFEHSHTERDPKEPLFIQPEFGHHTALFNEMILALEQENFCDFEVQFEMTHNAIHYLVGGTKKHSLSSLHYSAFDPIFFLHHSNVDRIWAIWQALQIRRHKPYKAHCAYSQERESLKPFAFHSPLNNNEKTYGHAVPTNVYDYEGELGYHYDDLSFGGMNLAELEEYIHKNKQNDRTFAGFYLSHIGTSATVEIYINGDGEERHKAGTFVVLGGEKEMAWGFDRMYKYDITEAVHEHHLDAHDGFHVSVRVIDANGTELSSDLIRSPALIFDHGHAEVVDHGHDHIVRKNVEDLTNEEMNALRRAMADLQSDNTIGGFQQISEFHGEPKWCPSPDAEKKFSCCVHGMATFPHWHRLFTVQAENALRKHGYDGALPYWDWTRPLSHLPDFVTADSYTDAISHESKSNPWNHGHINSVGQDTTRSVRDDLFEHVDFGHYTSIAQQVLLALEQDNFCDFEVQFEIAHNFIHALVGGNEPYSMASLRYTTFDPIFYLHHSNTDRIWATWQALQKHRGKPYNTANCAIASMRTPLQPFGLSNAINPDHETHEHAIPFSVFDYKHNFDYEYDTLDFNGLSIAQLDRETQRRQSHDRVFAGFLLHGIKKSALIKFQICESDDKCHDAGEFYVLGDEAEMPWEYDRLYKYEITDQLEEHHLHVGDRFFIHYEAFDLNGISLGSHIFPQPSVVHDPPHGSHDADDYTEAVTGASHIRKNLKDLSVGEIESLRSAFLTIHDSGAYERIAQFHGKPGLCDHDGHKVACCVHGMPTFPHWHRLYVVQVENALLEQGSAVAVPYWDWTEPFDKLPSLINDATYYNSRSQTFEPNPFFGGKISSENAVTTRHPQPQLWHSKYFYENVLLALEQDNFCDFEVQFEMVHNVLHSWLGGKAQYSLSSLDYSAFDPVFFLHHANTDRLWAIWQELQRYRKLPYNEANCAINLMRAPLHPFDSDELNHDPVTKKYSTPEDGFDYQNHFGYSYDDLELHHHSIPQLEEILHDRKQHDRVFAGFLLHNIGTSADVKIYICVAQGNGEQNCNNEAGSFTILGGETEMDFTFDRLYKYDISHSLYDLGIKLDSHDFDLRIKIHGVNGSYLDPHILHEPTIIFAPGEKSHQHEDGHTEDVLVRKEVNSLSSQETLSLIRALTAMQHDESPDGFQAIASFHALPALCPNPSAEHRYACCVHGMATFPQWHRLYTVQFQDALKRHGAKTGVPYWDWLRPQSHLPELVTMETYHDNWKHKDLPNPFYQAHIEFEGHDVMTHREVVADKLFVKGEHIYDNWFYNQAIVALEQENYCDFEIQFEILHNGLHSWVGGTRTHSIGHLHYASYDPLFYIHHSQTDRIWAIWQALQKHRGLNGDEAHCALEQMREPLKPFSFGAPYNLNDHTHDFSKPEDTFDYHKFGYEYDSLEFVGMSIPELDHYIVEHQEEDRVFAGFLLSGFGSSASVSFKVCRPDHSCEAAGYFTVLGGSAEMPWEFDRLYKYDITHTLHDMHLRHDDPFTISVSVTSYNGTELSASLIPTPSVIYAPGHRDINTRHMPANRIRHDLSTLSKRDIASLKSALRVLKEDDGPNGYVALASFHGLPAECHDSQGHEIACCIHGMPTFPHWHRLYTLQMEVALRRHGSSVAIPYWDWTKPISKLPELFTSPEYYDVWKDEVVENPFSRGHIKSEGTFTVREVQDELFHLDDLEEDHHSFLFDQTLLALEQTDYCDFEVQFEVLHNVIHYLLGGHQKYALSSLHYASYDPVFFIHHSFVDKIWVVWQALQKRRKLPYNRADCALNLMTKSMRPFDSDLNHNDFTKEHAVPNTLFDFENLHYNYDNLEIGGKNLDQLEAMIHSRKSHPRVFAGFLLHGIGTSADVQFSICTTGDKCIKAGIIFILGGSKEMPWSFDRNFKYDITHALERVHIHPEDVFDAEEPFHIKVDIHAVNKTRLPASTIPAPTIIYSAGEGHHDEHHSSGHISGSGVRKDVTTLTASEVDDLRHAMQAVMDDHGPEGYQAIAAFHGSPAMCEMDGHKVACCAHGMASFPHWHRLFVKQMEDALAHHGSHVGIPYWDWTTAFTELPALVTDSHDNPFHHGHIDHLNVDTTRAPRDMLFNDPEQGKESFFYRQVLLALEQTDYCQFEVQYELTHNAIHSWTGGKSPYGMSTLEYTAYDPLFWLHHSNTDRIWAIWQALQKYRGLPYNEAHCEIQVLKQPLKPFSDDRNHNPTTKANSRPIDSFDYERFNYQYDTLDFHGHTIPELEALLQERKKEGRTFAAFLLHGIKKSADVIFDICRPNGDCVFAGTFAVLGGELEMPWSFDRLFRYDITKVLKQLYLRYDSQFTFHVKIVATDGTELPSNIIKAPTIEHEDAVPNGKRNHHHEEHVHDEDEYFRKDIDSLSLDEANDLKNALYKMQNDVSLHGYEAIAGYHGYPNLCPEQGDDHYPCCVHGMPIFPHWHRLHTIQIERALREHGAHLGVPYWDWTKKMTALPPFFGDPANNNPFYKFYIRGVHHVTSRHPSNLLFEQPQVHGYDYLYYLALETLEEDNYCDFEVQYEILHNAVHAWIGGNATHSMSTLEYSAFDPVFMILHSGLDRLWIIWQELQKLRKKPYNAASCAGKMMDQHLHPFNYESINKDEFTRANSKPSTVFDSQKFGYHYDNLNVRGHDVKDIFRIINDLRREPRIYAGFVLAGIKTTANVKIYLKHEGHEDEYVGSFAVLGGEREMPWAYERIFKFDITEVTEKLHLTHEHNFHFRLEVVTPNGQPVKNALPDPLIIYRPANHDYDVLVVDLASDVHLPPKVVVKRGTKVEFHAADDTVQKPAVELGSYTALHDCVVPPYTFHGFELDHVYSPKPGDYFVAGPTKELCQAGMKIHIHVGDE